MNTSLSKELVLSTIEKGNIFFFCGSGISYDSHLPSAHEILKNTCDIFLPSYVSDLETNKIIDNIQPEVFYEILLRVTNNYDALNIWKCLHKDFNDSKPNLSHIFIVKYSFKNSIPIITTNFDLMFEMAADLLEIPYIVLMPNDPPPKSISNRVVICKIHGSISDKNEKYNPKGLWTTMTSITKINIPWVKYIYNTMKDHHICFVGYSGRDIDYFPYIKNFSEQKSTKKVFWINKFDEDEYSNKKSKLCNALKVNYFPSEIFTLIDNDIKNNDTINNNDTNFVIKKLKCDILNKNIISKTSKEVFYINILQALGKYQKAYLLSVKIKNKKISHKHYKIFLLNFCRLNHEVSKYETCGILADKLIELCKKDLKNNIGTFIQAKCLKSESLRMSIPNDLYFKYNKSKKRIVRSIYVVFHFILTTLQLIFYTKIYYRKEKLSSNAQHEFIEHNIRFVAILQSVMGSQKNGWGNIRKKILIYLWEHLRKKSYSFGYAAGIANSQKFKQRLFLESNTKSSLEAEEIFKLTTSSTGKELIIRNNADLLIKNNKHKKAICLFREQILMANLSGNRLNGIKGYLGIAYSNSINKIHPLMDKNDYNIFLQLVDEMEGNLWKNYLYNLSNEFYKGLK